MILLSEYKEHLLKVKQSLIDGRVVEKSNPIKKMHNAKLQKRYHEVKMMIASVESFEERVTPREV